MVNLEKCGLQGLVLIMNCLLVASAAAEESHLFRLLEKVTQSYESVRDYTALFYKRERVDGEWMPEETVFLKFQKPFRVYLRWLPGAHGGREALYVEGANGNKVLIHEPDGIARFFTFLLDPGGWRILQESRYPFTEIGIGRLIERIAQDARRAWSKGELRLIDRGTSTIKGREVLEVEGILPRDPRAGYSYYRSTLSIDREFGLPVKASIYDWDNRLVGTYAYTDLRLNLGLGNEEFDSSNSAYNFPSWRISLAEE